MTTLLRCWMVFLLAASAWAQPAKTNPEPPAQSPPPDLGPEHLRWVLTYPSLRPPSRLMIQVQPKDKPWLLKRFRYSRRLGDRVAAAWLLAYLGDDEVFRVLSWSVLHSPRDQRVPPGELFAFSEPLTAIGIVAQTNEAAYAFLKQGVSPEWWRKNRQWRHTTMERGTVLTLAAVAIEALGLTGRREVEEFLDQLVAKETLYVLPEDKRYTLDYRGHQGYVREAKCYLRVCQQMGLEAFRAHLFDAEYRRLALAWRKSGEGLRLLEKEYPKDRYPEVWTRLDARLAEAESVKSEDRDDFPMKLRPFKK